MPLVELASKVSAVRRMGCQEGTPDDNQHGKKCSWDKSLAWTARDLDVPVAVSPSSREEKAGGFEIS